MRTRTDANGRDGRERDAVAERVRRERRGEHPEERHEPLEAAGLGEPMDWDHYAESRLHDFARR